MTLLEMCKDQFDRITDAINFTPSVVNLCDEHNLKLTAEYKEIDRVFRATCSTKRVTMLFGKTVIEESRQGVTKCLVCDYIARSNA